MRIAMCVLACLLAARPAPAQPVAGSVDARANVAIGQIYLDEGFPDHTEAGGSIRAFVSTRLAVQGELSTFSSNVAGLPDEFKYAIYATAVRLFGSAGDRLQPYIIGGINVRSGGIGNTATWPYGGVGFHVPFGGRLSAEFEVGGPLLRIGASLGIRLR